jgi:hypothetical protein
MKYEAPELVTLTPAINAVRSTKATPITDVDPSLNEVVMAYEDWED